MNNSAIAIPIVLTTLVILLLIAGITVAFFISGRRQMLQRAELAEARTHYQQELRKAEAEVSEAMMGRFSRELHDNIGQLLTCMRITIENKKLDEPALTNAFGTVEAYLDDATQQVRMLSRSMNADHLLGGVGLVGAVTIEVERLRRLRLFTVHVTTVPKAVSINKDGQLMAFRIFQEMVHNAIRHAQSSELHIALSDNNGLYLEVSDNGCGFDVEKTLHSSGASGLRNMIRRAELVGLTCQIRSGQGSGTTCILTLARSGDRQNEQQKASV